MMTMQVQTVLVALALQCSAAVALPAVGPAPFPATMAALYSQYHAQDELGRYSFGYSGPASSKHEHKSADGVTSGSYSYMDPYGVMQTRAYTADDVNGFRVAASDLPSMPAGPAMDSAMGRAMSPAMSPVMGRAMGPAMSPAMDSAMGRAMGPAMGAAGPASGRRIYSPGYATDWQTDGSLTRWSLTNLEHANIPEAEAHYPYNTMEQRYLAAPPAPHQPMELPGGLKSQFHAQDELGQYTYGYANENAAKMETKTADGVTRGSFSYMDPSGRPQSRSYVADDAGFRVVASDLPQMPQPSKAA